jgi:hypothetical protein
LTISVERSVADGVDRAEVMLPDTDKSPTLLLTFLNQSRDQERDGSINF